MISVVIPTLNAGGDLRRALNALRPARDAGLVGEVIVADGGSTDDTADVAFEHGCQIVIAAPGRGGQLAAGADAATGDWLLFLHADTVLAEPWADAARDFIDGGGGRAGAFRFKLDDRVWIARVFEAAVALRCAAFRLPYGDQGLLMSRALYDKVGGFSHMPLFEDVDMVRRLGRRRIAFLDADAVTSAERYRRDGYLKRAFKNLRLLRRYYRGEPTADLARLYG